MAFNNTIRRTFSSGVSTSGSSGAPGPTIMDKFYSFSRYAVAGASADRSKFGNKVLRCYLQKGYDAIPVSIKCAEIEGLSCVKSVREIDFTKGVGLSIVTPPKATRQVLEEALDSGCTRFALQPGTYDAEVDSYIDHMTLNPDVVVLKTCVLVDLSF